MLTIYAARPYLDIIDIPSHQPLSAWNLTGNASTPMQTRPTRYEHVNAQTQGHARDDKAVPDEHAKIPRTRPQLEVQQFS